MYMAGPLDGVKVLDLASYIAGPFACGLLADLGAEVIKVEPPEGDMQRKLPSTAPGEARSFLGLNRRKKSLSLNLKTEGGKHVLRELVRTADVLVENFRPGVMERLGLGYEDLKKTNPSLIYFAISGYGSSGPLRNSPGFDTVLQTFSGIANFQGAATDSPPHNVSGSILDYYAASLGALGVVAALHHRALTGVGQYAETSLLATSLALQAARFVWVDGEPREVNRDLQLGKISGIHPTQEGYLFVSAHAEHFWQALCEIVGLPELASNPRYDSMRKRTEHAVELVPQLREKLKARKAVEWESLLAGRVPSSAARSIEDMFDHPQVHAGELVAQLPAENGRPGYKALHSPIAFHATPVGHPTPAPSLGQHSDEILAAHGWSLQQVQNLRTEGAVL
jgi:crotonobetainyl-CoA:carnitine CoA-transferase CaiB-like acyl-CoA transferase